MHLFPIINYLKNHEYYRTMIDKKAYALMKKELEAAEKEREIHTQSSRELTRKSKLAIYSIHRGELAEAENGLAEVKREITKIKRNSNIYYFYAPSLQEYCEAACFYAFIKGKPIPTHKQLDLDAENYLLGICDLTGELARMAVNKAIKNDKKSVEEIRSIIDLILGEFLKFDLKNGELRKKYDSIKWNLSKVEQVLYDLKRK
jgi:predicted translin family RNA/ssDNA-binding protein